MNARRRPLSPLAEDGTLLFYLLAIAWLLCSGL